MCHLNISPFLTKPNVSRSLSSGAHGKVDIFNYKAYAKVKISDRLRVVDFKLMLQ